MAEGFGNEKPENPDYALFAEDLVDYVMLRNSPRYTLVKEPEPFRLFFNSEIIQNKFCDALRIIESNHENFTITMQYHSNTVNPTGYLTTISRLEDNSFDEGFNASCFLIHCASISLIAALFYNKGVDTTPELAKSHIVNVLKNRMPADQWNTVRGTVKIFPLPNVQSSESSDSNE